MNKQAIKKGRLTNISPGGAGFVETDDETVFVPPGKINDASTGDQVQVEIEKPPRPEQNLYAEACITDVEETGNGTITGRVIHHDGEVVIRPADGDDEYIDIEDDPPRPGARVRARLIDDDRRAVVQDVIESGRSSVPNAVQDAIEAHEVPEPYTNPKQHRGDIESGWSSTNRTDATDETILTIDPADAEDYDDAVSVRSKSDGFEVAVHIADVAHYLKDGSALQNRARKRAFTLYLPGDDTRRMLPDELSEDLSSLIADGQRPALTARFALNNDGRIVEYTFEESVVDVTANLSYDEADERMDEDSEIGRALRQLRDAADARRAYRKQQGALLIETPERSIDASAPKRVKSRSRSNTSYMIEEMMIAANVAAARFLREHDAPVLYRTHEPPGQSDLNEFRSVLKASGYDTPKTVTSQNLSRTLQAVASQASEYEYAALSKVMLGHLNAAEYSPAEETHYGIGGSLYTHFTSPIRRFPDLINHRTIRDVIRGRRSDWEDRRAMLNGYSGFLAEREKTYRTIEFSLKDRLQLEDLKHSSASGPYRGMVVGSVGMGSFVYLENHVEGLLKGQNRPLGERVTVEVDRIRPEADELDLDVVDE